MTRTISAVKALGLVLAVGIIAASRLFAGEPESRCPEACP
jgi:hypothetical protein